MPVQVKIDLAARLAAGPLRVEIGCGAKKRDGFVGIDVRALEGVDLVGDAREALASLPARSVIEIAAHHALEHLPDFEGTLREISRVLRDDGVARVTVPHFSNPCGWSDPTHERLFGLYTFFYYCPTELQFLRRKVPHYTPELAFAIDELALNFRPAHRGSSRTSRFMTWLVNGSRKRQEFYEAHLCWLVPCYEVHVAFRNARASASKV